MMKFAIIGTGAISKTHLAAIKSIKGCEVVAVYEPKEEWARLFAINAKCKYYTDYNVLLKEDIDIVDIANENYLHADFASRALDMGKHVLLEKPIDSDIEKAKSLVKLSKSKDAKLGIILQHRYDTAFMELSQMITENKLGNILSANIKMHWFRGKDYYEGLWRNDLKLSGGGVVMQQGLHFLDILIWLFGDVKSVYTKIESTRNFLNVEDYAVGLIKFKNGCYATFEFSTALPLCKDHFEVIGTKNRYVLSGHEVVNCGLAKKLKSRFFYRYGNHKDIIMDFIKSIECKSEFKINGEEGLKSLKLIQAIYESANNDKEVVMSI